MRNFTKIVLSLVMAFGLLGGVNSVSATKTNWSPSNWVATWDGGTNTMSWNGSDGYKVLRTGLETGDLDSKYTKIRVDITSITGDNDYIQMKVVSTGKSDQLINLTTGVNNIIFADYSSVINFSDVTEITLWGTGSSDGSAVITDCYLYNPVKTVSVASFGTEITDISYIVDGTRFAIGNGTNAMYWTTASVDGKNSLVTNVPSDSYYYYKLEKVDGLDTDGDSEAENDNYRILIVNSSNEAAVVGYNFGPYLNYSQYGNLFAATAREKTGSDAHTYGWDNDYYAIWKVAYSDGNGFTLKNAGINKYATLAGSSDAITYLKFYQSIVYTPSTDLEKENNAANDAIFALADADGYDADTGVMTDGTWTFDTPVDLTDWDYLMITTSNTAADASHEITIKDNDGVTVKGEDYTGSTAGTGKNMWLDRWNNQNAIRISMDYLRKDKSMDISQIKSLKINGTVKVANVYLTDYNNTKINGGYCEGDVKREYTATGKWGTICLPYKASYAGADVYSIEGETGGSLVLNKVTGLLEAGKAYFYKSADVNGQNNEGAVRNVNFFRADLDTYDAATPVAAASNNGLTGTFLATTAPSGSYVLSNGKLYQVDGVVAVGANKAWVDRTCVPAIVTARGDIYIDFDGETTGINATLNDKGQMTNDKVVYNLAGQRVAQPTKGLYIVNGKKIIIK